jgi:AraC family transcriptional regulator
LPSCTLREHDHPEARLVLPLQHVIESCHARRELLVHAGEALYRPARQMHADRYVDAVGCLVLLLPDDAGQPRLADAFVARCAGVAEISRALLAEMPADDTAADLVREGLALTTTTLALQRRPLAERGSPGWLRTVVERLADPTAAAPTLSELARAVDRDPVHLAETFRCTYGQSVGVTLRRLRLERARGALAREPDLALADVALQAGFADQSHFTRHFRRLFGVTPGQYRRRRYGVGAPSDAA